MTLIEGQDFDMHDVEGVEGPMFIPREEARLRFDTALKAGELIDCRMADGRTATIAGFVQLGELH